MIWEYDRKEVHDKRLDAHLAQKGSEGWELAYAHRGKETRVNSDPDIWEVLFKRPKLPPAPGSQQPQSAQEQSKATAPAAENVDTPLLPVAKVERTYQEMMGICASVSSP